MSLQRQSIPISFTQGLDTKTDPFQVEAGKFLALSNSVFTNQGLLQKRNGFPQLSEIPSGINSTLTTFHGDLTAIGNNIQAYSAGTGLWTDQGFFQSASLSVLPVIRNNLNQTQSDIAIAPNNLGCIAYSELNGPVTQYKFSVFDTITGQNLIVPTVIVPTAGTVIGAPKVFLLGQFFIVVFSSINSGTNQLEYIPIGINTLIVGSAAVISSVYTPSSTGAFDAIMTNGTLYLAWNGSDGGGAIRAITLSQHLILTTAKVFAGHSATLMSVTADTTGNAPNIYISFYNSGTSTGYVIVCDQNLNTITAATEFITTGTVLNLTSVAQNAVLTVFYEISNSYSYNSSIPTNYIETNTITKSGTVGTASVFVRSVGLATKATLLNAVPYLVGTYQSPYQPTYFIFNGSAKIVGKVAYSNGGGYVTTGLGQINVSNNVLSFGYLYKDEIQALSAIGNTQQSVTGGVYSQTGINLAAFTIGVSQISTVETGNDLHLSGGFLWMYDGYYPVEHNFFLWPDSVQATFTASSTVTPTGTITTGSNIITSLSSSTGIAVGMTISGTGIPAGALVAAFTSSTITMNANATGSHTSETLTIQGNVAAQPDSSTNTNAYYYQVTYEWTDNQGNIFRSAPSIPVSVTTTGSGSTGSITLNIPSLRLTYKIATPPKIVIYRWSVAQQNYFQVTSITAPLLNPNILTTDSVTFVDVYSDADIDGASLIYTTGGVVEDINAPASNVMTLFDSRLWLVDAEDPNLLWYSKQVIEATPVEMSDLFTYYVDPNLSPQGSTGDVLALSTLDEKLILYKKDSIFYINGTGPDNTGANSQYSAPTFITSTVGCANQNSIVFIPSGLLFQSDKGIWLLGRDLSTSYVGAPVEMYNQNTVLSAVNVPMTNQVRFTLDNGVTLQYDYYYNQWGTFNGIPGTSSTIYNSLHTYLNSDNFVFQENDGYYLDNSNPVLINFKTSWFHLANIQGYQRAFFFYLLGTYVTPHKLLIQIAYDYNPSPTQTVLVSPNNYSPAWGGDTNWGSGQYWGGGTNIENWKINLARQKCEAFQITLTEIYDPTFQVPSGAGFTLSGLNLVIGTKKGYRPISAALTTG
jgi:hypothetical protein